MKLSREGEGGASGPDERGEDPAEQSFTDVGDEPFLAAPVIEIDAGHDLPPVKGAEYARLTRLAVDTVAATASVGGRDDGKSPPSPSPSGPGASGRSGQPGCPDLRSQRRADTA